MLVVLLGSEVQGRPPGPGHKPGAPGGNLLQLFRLFGVDAGSLHTCAVTRSGQVFCWGLNDRAQLGSFEAGGGGFSPRPVPVGGVPTDFRFRQVSAGGLGVRGQAQGSESHTCGVTRRHRAVCWGANDSGQLGDGTNVDLFTPEREVSGGHRFLGVSAGGRHTCGVTLAGQVLYWGSNSSGQLGDGNSPTPSTVAIPPTLPRQRYLAVSAGELHTCALSASHEIFCWGRNAFGQLGIGTTEADDFPNIVAGFYSAVSAGFDHTCAVEFASRAVVCWGRNDDGELGIGDNSGPETCFGIPCSTVPLVIPGASRFRSVSAGWNHTCAVTTDNRAFCWGSNVLGQLGVSPVKGLFLSPFPVVPLSVTFTTPGPFPMTRRLTLPVAVVTTGFVHTCAVAVSGGAFCWGANDFGMVGDDTTENRFEPVAVFSR